MRHTHYARRLYSTSARYKQLPKLTDLSLKTLRVTFTRSKPVLLPSTTLQTLPASKKWFHAPEANAPERRKLLNIDYLSKYDGTSVPLEFTFLKQPEQTDHTNSDVQIEDFRRAECPLGDFLKYVAMAQNSGDDVATKGMSIYIAQCPITSLPMPLQKDLPTPDFALHAGRGDIYGSSIWLGLAPTHTPLHKDPNPNLFVQMAGSKSIRLFDPTLGNEIFERGQRELGLTGSASIRGDEMMKGQEKRHMYRMVWGDISKEFEHLEGSFEAHLEQGDRIFIPKGWWHSIIGTGEGITGSANWWFR